MRILVLVAALAAGPAGAAELKGIAVVADDIIQLDIVDGRGIYSTLGKPINEHVEGIPLDLKSTARPGSWRVASGDDEAYRGGRAPEKVGRKTKGRDYAIADEPQWHIEFSHEHAIYLVLPEPMKPGKTYEVEVEGVVGNAKSATLTFEPGRTFSEAIHVNQIGYAPGAPKKIAYLSAWLGDLGSLTLDEYVRGEFRIVDCETGQAVFTGKPSLRRRADGEPDSGQPDELHHFRTDVWECDFSSLTKTGEYVLSLDRLGASFPFHVGEDVYREAFVTVMRGLFHQRCGIERKKKHTDYVRPVCHHPDIKPIYRSTRRYMDGHCDACKDVQATKEKSDSCGGYHDAGDWDREGGHPEVPMVLAFTYELAPGNFRDREQNIPESGNGLPDILDEAMWGIDYYRRLQDPDGGVSMGLFLDSFPDKGEAPHTDTGNWYVYAPDPDASYKYASAACHVAFALGIAGRAGLGRDYIRTAAKAWDWAEKNRTDEDAKALRDTRLHAAACLLRATGEARYHEAFRKDCLIRTGETPLLQWGSVDQRWAAWVYALTERKEADPELRERMRQAALNYARRDYVETAEKRAGRYGGQWYTPMWWGTAAVPDTIPLMVAHVLSKNSPEFLWPQYTNCDAMLGGNPLNMVWVTGLGERFPEQVFHPDSWYTSPDGRIVPGIVPEGPYKYTGEPDPKSGPWDPKFVQSSAYPPAGEWPPLELYFEARTCYPNNEFTVAQMARAAAAYGYLCSRAK